MARARCNLCQWRSPDYQSSDVAERESMWHVFEQHRPVWLALFGLNRPRDPDPRVQAYDVGGRGRPP